VVSWSDGIAWSLDLGVERSVVALSEVQGSWELASSRE